MNDKAEHKEPNRFKWVDGLPVPIGYWEYTHIIEDRVYYIYI